VIRPTRHNTPRRASIKTTEVSVIVATYRGASRIGRTLESLAEQSLSPDKFEIIIVANGPNDGTRDVLQTFCRAHPQLTVRWLETPHASAASARNLGVGAAAGTYATFLDDDDWISPTFLESLLDLAGPGHVVLAPFRDFGGVETSRLPFDNYITKSIYQNASGAVSFRALPSAASANSGKLAPVAMLRTARFDPELRSGEDVAFWSEILAFHRPRLMTVSPETRAVYNRHVREESVSRTDDPQFVHDRFAVIERLHQLSARYPEMAAPLGALARSQAIHLGHWITKHPESEPEIRDIARRSTPPFPYSALNGSYARRLVIAYAFSPFVDTSATVVSRRLHEWRVPVDVVTQDMKNVRSTDADSTVLSEEWVGAVMRVPGAATFTHWKNIEKFCVDGLERVETRERNRGTYDSVYSRAMWPAAHVLGALLKLRHPEVHWIAEFSDPLLVDSSGKLRESEIPESAVFDEIEMALRAQGLERRVNRNLWEWVEDIAYALADEIVYTNENQQTYMEGLLSERSPSLAERPDRKTTIARHPTLPRHFYEIQQSSYALQPGRVHIGYFGVFYPSRGVGDLTSALLQLPESVRRKICLHIFTNDQDAVALGIDETLRRSVEVNPYVSYLEFLELSTHFDWLLVADARAAAHHGINPYLPSKYSDYVGSGSKIWALVEPGSSLSRLDVDMRSSLGDVEAAAQFLRRLAGESQRQGAAQPA